MTAQAEEKRMAGKPRSPAPTWRCADDVDLLWRQASNGWQGGLLFEVAGGGDGAGLNLNLGHLAREVQAGQDAAGRHRNNEVPEDRQRYHHRLCIPQWIFLQVHVIVSMTAPPGFPGQSPQIMGPGSRTQGATEMEDSAACTLAG